MKELKRSKNLLLSSEFERFPKEFRKKLKDSFLGDRSIVLQVHSVRALSRIAKAYPGEAPKILNHLTGSKEHFSDNRMGFIIEAMEYFLDYRNLLPMIREFIE